MAKKSNQSNMFAGTNADLPLVSGTAQRAQESVFKPAPAERQLKLDIPAVAGDLVESAHAAVDLIGDYLGSTRPDRGDLERAMDILEFALAKHYEQSLKNIEESHERNRTPDILFFNRSRK
jgi:hypothetical protein